MNKEEENYGAVDGTEKEGQKGRWLKTTKRIPVTKDEIATNVRATGRRVKVSIFLFITVALLDQDLGVALGDPLLAFSRLTTVIRHN